MDARYIAIIILTLMLIGFIVFYDITGNENFANKQEKASTILEWWKKQTKPSYERYKQDLNRESNIVEYEDAMDLFKKNNLTLATITNIV